MCIRDRVTDGRVAAYEECGRAADAQTAAGPRVLIEAEGAPGSLPAAGAPQLPGGPEIAPGPDGTTRLTVPAPHSDALLRALLTARPPWHIRAVTAAPRPYDAPGTAPVTDDAPAPHEAPLP